MMTTKTSNVMGQAAFFSVYVHKSRPLGWSLIYDIRIVGVMLPPSLPLSVFFAAITTLLIGMLLGWALGNAAMASALSVRSATLLAQQQQNFKASIKPDIPVALQQQIAIYHGAFLDPRSSAVYGAFLFIFTFLLGALRAYLPNLALMSIFGTIVLDVVCGVVIPVLLYSTSIFRYAASVLVSLHYCV